MPDERKISPYVVSAMCGCWAWESGMNPGIWESLIPTTWDHEYQYDGIGGFGLGQWTNVGTPYGRCYNLHTWVTSQGYSDGDLYGQLNFVLHENYWTAANSVMGYNNLSEFLSSTSTNLPLLVEEFLACWEGVPGNKLTERIAYAQNYYQYIYDNKSASSSSWKQTSGNFYQDPTGSAAHANVMLVYWWAGGVEPEPPGPTPGNNGKGMPLWFFMRRII